jgi:hypothetical protein
MVRVTPRVRGNRDISTDMKPSLDETAIPRTVLRATWVPIHRTTARPVRIRGTSKARRMRRSADTKSPTGTWSSSNATLVRVGGASWMRRTFHQKARPKAR